MKIKLIPLVILSIGFLLTNVYARNNVAVTLDDCVTELLSRSASLSSRSVISIAVLPFTPTQKDLAADNQFGDYFAEVLTSKLSERKEFKVFERNRLDAVTKELALNVSGIINENEAKKIGELAPIDYILTGTFTKMKEEIQINGRIINVVSGEIDAGFSRLLKLNNELSALFPTVDNTPDQPQTPDQPETQESSSQAPGDPCVKLFNEFDPLFIHKDYPSIAKKAADIPFTNKCASIHSDVLYLFMKKRYFDNTYHSFLLQQLTSPKPDNVSGYIRGSIEYLGLDGSIDKEEWKAITTCLSKSMKRPYYMSSLFDASAFVHTFTENEVAERKLLMDDYINNIDGFSDPKGSSIRVMDLLSAFKSKYVDSDLNLYFYWIEKYSSNLQSGDIAQLMSSVRDVYGKGVFLRGDTANYARLTTTMATLTRYDKIDNAVVAAIESYLWMFFHVYDQYPFFKNQLKIYTLQCKNQLAKIIPQLPAKAFDDELIRYCLQYGIEVPGKVPSLDSLVHNLTVDNSSMQSKASEYLRLVTITKPEYLRIISKTLERSLILDESGGFYFQIDLINMISGSKSTDPQFHKSLINCLTNSKDEILCDSTIAAIGRMGNPIIPSLKSSYETAKEPLRLKIIKAIGSMGRSAKSEIPWLQAKRNGAGSPALKDQIDDTIDLVGR